MKKAIAPILIVVVIIGIYALNKHMGKKSSDTTTEPPSKVASRPDPKTPEIPAVPAARLMFEKGILITDGTKPLIVGLTASPEVTDFNNDGKKDLLVGTFNAGAVHLFLNKGTDSKPVFDGSSKILAGEVALKVGSG